MNKEHKESILLAKRLLNTCSGIGISTFLRKTPCKQALANVLILLGESESDQLIKRLQNPSNKILKKEYSLIQIKLIALSKTLLGTENASVILSNEEGLDVATVLIALIDLIDCAKSKCQKQHNMSCLNKHCISNIKVFFELLENFFKNSQCVPGFEKACMEFKKKTLNDLKMFSNMSKTKKLTEKQLDDMRMYVQWCISTIFLNS